MYDTTRTIAHITLRFFMTSLFILFLTSLVALDALGQTKGVNESSARPSPSLLSPNVSPSSPFVQQPLFPEVLSTSHVVASTAQTQSLRANKPESQNPLFLPATVHNTGGWEAISFDVADVNGDGKLDLLVTNTYYSNTIGVLFGHGDGTFGHANTYPSGGGGPVSIAVVDINHDGKPDLIVSNQSPCYACAGDGVLAVLFGNGDGTFGAPVTYDSGGVDAGPLAIADVNNDGIPDVVVSNCAPTGGQDLCGTGPYGIVSVFLGNSDGTFQPAVTYITGALGLGGIAVADVNGDGKPDVLVTDGCAYTLNCPDGSVGVLLGNGDGSFQSPNHYSSGGWGSGGMSVADVNGDGRPDIVVGNCGGSNCWTENGLVGILLGNGDGTFQPAATYDSGGALAGFTAVVDVDGDGKLDILVSNVVAQSVGVLLGNGGGTFQTPLTYASGGNFTYTVRGVDLNGDGHPDIIVSSCGRGNECGGGVSGVVGVLLNNTLPHSTTTVIKTSGSPSNPGQPVTFTATIESKFGAIPNGESVAFSDGAISLGSAPLASGKAVFTTSSLSPGKHIIKAAYSGDATFNSSSGSVVQRVERYVTATALSSGENPSQSGQAVAFTAQVTSTGPAPTGKVQFLDGTVGIGSATLSAAKLS